MRLICPNCDAQYEVHQDAIPEAGRDVQCSNCGHSWFQIREASAEDPSDALYREPEPENVTAVPVAVDQTDEDYDEEDTAPAQPAGPARVQRSLDTGVLAILREEAELEMAARRAEAGGLEMQGDLGLPPPVSPAVGSAAAADRTETEKRIASIQGEPSTSRRAATRRDLLPDIEEINSSLRPNDAVARREAATEARQAGVGAGFRSGFVLMMFLAVVAIAVYVMAPQIAAQIPGAADALASYVSLIDSLRIWLDDLMRQATGAVNGLTGS
ncbi:MAG: zinc-ribbon domain-containing protein [Paracoccaceae bacterium]